MPINTHPIPVSEDFMYGVGYNALDGHHTSARLALRDPNATVEVWVTTHEKDFLNADEFPEKYRAEIEMSNNMIKKRFQSAQFYVPKGTDGEDIFSITDLLQRHHTIDYAS